jgi:hypothetical protein
MKILNTPIEVLAEHDVKGQVTPIRFRIKVNGDLQVYNVKVKTVDIIRVEKENVRCYACEIQDGDIKKECELRFFTQRIIWILYKM